VGGGAGGAGWSARGGGTPRDGSWGGRPRGSRPGAAEVWSRATVERAERAAREGSAAPALPPVSPRKAGGDPGHPLVGRRTQAGRRPWVRVLDPGGRTLDPEGRSPGRGGP
jgi:hypothetical protein